MTKNKANPVASPVEKLAHIAQPGNVCTKEEMQAIAQASYHAGVFCGMIKMLFFFMILYILITCFRREE